MEISQDFKKVLFANQDENYILETIIDKKGKVTTSVNLLHQLEGKIVRYICHDVNKRDFYLVACNDFDKQIEIVSTKNPKFVIDFPYAVEPGILEIYDVSIRILLDECYNKKTAKEWDQYVDDENEFIMQNSCFKYELNFSGERDEGYIQSQSIFDTWEYKEFANPWKQAQKGFNVDKEKISNFSTQKINGMCFKWPYITFQGLQEEYLNVINVFDRNQTHRIKFPDDK